MSGKVLTDSEWRDHVLMEGRLPDKYEEWASREEALRGMDPVDSGALMRKWAEDRHGQDYRKSDEYKKAVRARSVFLKTAAATIVHHAAAGWLLMVFWNWALADVTGLGDVSYWGGVIWSVMVCTVDVKFHAPWGKFLEEFRKEKT